MATRHRTPQHVLDELDIRRVLINLVKYDPNNARTHSKRNLDAIEASLRAFGQRKPLVVDKDLVVIAGNGTLSVMNDRLNWGTVWVSVFPGTAAEARTFGIADNRTGELAGWDEDLLADSLLQVSQWDETLLAGSGYLAGEIENLIAGPDPGLLLAAVGEQHRGVLAEPGPTRDLPPNQPAAAPAAAPARAEPPASTPTPGLPSQRDTRTLSVEFPAWLFTWLTEALATYRTEHGLANTAEALAGMVEECSGTPAPDAPSGITAN